MEQEEKYWQSITVSNNRLYDAGKFEQALLGYKDALGRAEVLNTHMMDCIRLDIPFVQLYIISCTNLLNTYEVLGYIAEAEMMLNRMLYYLLHLSENETLDKHLIQAELRRVTIIYHDFIKSNSHIGQTTESLLVKVKELLRAYNLIGSST